MRNFMRNFVAAAGIALSVLAVASLSTPVAYAQPVPLGQRSFSPRVFQTQQLHYLRFSVNFNSCVYVSLTCTVKVGTLPYNAFMVQAIQQTTTTWNAGTSASVGIGTNSPATNFVPSTAIQTAGNANSVLAATAVGLGNPALTGSGIAQTGTLGGFDVNATITIVGALPTAGATQYVLTYVAPNDGSCAPVPLGSTAPAC